MPGRRRKELCHARQIGTRQEPQAVRGAQGQGHVEGAGGQDRQLTGRLQARRREVAQRIWQEQPGRYPCPTQGRRPQGRQGRRQIEVTVSNDGTKSTRSKSTRSKSTTSESTTEEI